MSTFYVNIKPFTLVIDVLINNDDNTTASTKLFISVISVDHIIGAYVIN